MKLNFSYQFAKGFVNEEEMKQIKLHTECTSPLRMPAAADRWKFCDAPSFQHFRGSDLHSIDHWTTWNPS